MTKPVRWSKKGGGFNTNYTIKVEVVLHELSVTKSVMWNFHVNNSQENHGYNMVLGRNIFSELNIYICFYKNTIRENGGTHEECTAPMKDISKININSSSDWLKETIFQNKELWEREHVLEIMQHTRCILDTHYKNSTHLRLHQK